MRQKTNGALAGRHLMEVVDKMEVSNRVVAQTVANTQLVSFRTACKSRHSTRWPWHKTNVIESLLETGRMSLLARGAYWTLRCELWRTLDGTLPREDSILARACGCSVAEWLAVREEVLSVLESDGTRVWHRDLLEQFRETEAKIQSCRVGGLARAKKSSERSANAEQTHSKRSADLDLDLEVSKKQKPSANSTIRGDESPVDQRHYPLRETIRAYWETKNWGGKAPWSGRDAKALEVLLSSNPSWTVEQFTQCVHNRSKSDVNHAENPFAWIPKLASFAGGPLDRFGKPLAQGTGPGVATPSPNSIRTRVEEAKTKLAKQGYTVDCLQDWNRIKKALSPENEASDFIRQLWPGAANHSQEMILLAPSEKIRIGAIALGSAVNEAIQKCGLKNHTVTIQVA